MYQNYSAIAHQFDELNSDIKRVKDFHYQRNEMISVEYEWY